MPPDDTAEAISRLQLSTFDDALGHRIIGTHMWAVREGLRGADAYRSVRRLLPASGRRQGSRCGARTWRWKRCIRNGTATATPGGATSTPSSPSNYAPRQRSKTGFSRTSPLNHLIRQGPGRRGESLDAPAPRERTGRARFPGRWRSSSPGATDYVAYLFVFGEARATARREPASSIRSRPTGRAVSATTIRRSCRRRCPGFRWR